MIDIYIYTRIIFVYHCIIIYKNLKIIIVII